MLGPRYWNKILGLEGLVVQLRMLGFGDSGVRFHLLRLRSISPASEFIPLPKPPTQSLNLSFLHSSSQMVLRSEVRFWCFLCLFYDFACLFRFELWLSFLLLWSWMLWKNRETESVTSWRRRKRLELEAFPEVWRRGDEGA